MEDGQGNGRANGGFAANAQYSTFVASAGRGRSPDRSWAYGQIELGIARNPPLSGTGNPFLSTVQGFGAFAPAFRRPLAGSKRWNHPPPTNLAG